MHTQARQPRTVRGAFAVLAVVITVALGLAACAASEARIRVPGDSSGVGSSADHGVTSAADGYVPAGGVSAFDEHLPAIAKLNPDLRTAVQAAATAAIADGFDFVITSGWRSAAYQQLLLDDATETYGSFEEARKWVNTPELSTHVTGDAVDIGFTDANSWLSQHGADYGLCQTYSNEMWHFELAIEPGGTCPMQLDNAAG